MSIYVTAGALKKCVAGVVKFTDSDKMAFTPFNCFQVSQRGPILQLEATDRYTVGRFGVKSDPGLWDGEDWAAAVDRGFAPALCAFLTSVGARVTVKLDFESRKPNGVLVVSVHYGPELRLPDVESPLPWPDLGAVLRGGQGGGGQAGHAVVPLSRMSKFAGSGWDVRVTLGPSPESPVMVRSARDIEQAPPGEIVFAGAIASLKPSTTPDQEWP